MDFHRPSRIDTHQPMHARRPQPMAPVAIALPPQSLQNCRSSLLSTASSPRTPSGSPKWSPIHFPPAANRNSTDSWNSSNGPDEMEWEWKPEQVLLLTRTLDGLPAHLVTPFIGPVPPSNLLDKIARGVSHAKGPIDWPHSIRATRVKLLELAKKRAKEESMQRLDISNRENQFAANACSPTDAKRQNNRRPLYRQNSMDFMNVAGDHLDEDNITRLANRLRRPDKLVSTSIYHSYTRKSRIQGSDRSSPSPSSLMNPSTSSSSTLTSVVSWTSTASTPSRLRRSVSSLSTTSSMSMTSASSGAAPLSDRYLQRIKTVDADMAPIPPPKDTKELKLGSKRAPSYGVLAQGPKYERALENLPHYERRTSTSSCPSSDEEEKSRTERAKKQKTKGHVALTSTQSLEGPLLTCSPQSSSNKSLPSTPVLQRSAAQNVACKEPVDETAKNVPSPIAQRKRLPMNLQRNPSILGGELFPIHRSPKSTESSPSTAQPATPTVQAVLRQGSTCTSPLPFSQPSLSPVQTHVKTLRRVRRMAPGRRISFGGSIATIGDACAESSVQLKESQRTCLGSAFQLR